MEIFNTVSSVDNQSFMLIVFSILLSLLLSSIIVFTYDRVSRDVVSPDHYLQSLILMSLVTTIIMQSIGDSPARGFGIFGALAILRFRTQLFSPRNISFIFAAMGVGIACGVYSFITAVVGTLAFCAVAFFLRLTPFSKKNNLRGQLRLEMPGDDSSRLAVESAIRKYSKKMVLKRYRIMPPKPGESDHDKVEYSFDLYLHQEADGIQLSRDLKHLEGAANIRLTFDDTYITTYEAS